MKSGFYPLHLPSFAIKDVRFSCSQCSCHINILLQKKIRSYTDEMKMSVVTALLVPNSDSIKPHTTRCHIFFFSGAFPGRFPLYTCKLYNYDVFTSAAAQNLIPHFTGFNFLYCLIGHMPRNATYCSFTVTFSNGSNTFLQFSTKRFQTSCIAPSFFSSLST